MKRKHSPPKDPPAKILKTEYAYTPINTADLKLDFAIIKSKEDAMVQFRKIADIVLNKWVLFANSRHFRFGEIEFYLNHTAHKDTFTHGDEMQGELGKWYFHRSGKTYKSGTYKGLDISFGQGDKSHGGILIRSIQNMEDGSIIEGPCNTVNELLARCGVKEITDLKNLKGYSDSICGDSILKIMQTTLPSLPINNSIRVGLSLKKPDSDREYFIKVPYRFMTNSNKIAKEKMLIALELLNSKETVSKVATILGMKISKVEEAKSMLTNPKTSTDIKDFIGKTLKAEDYAALIKLR